MDNYLNQVLGERYEMKEIIGVGGMAVVYKAYDRVDDRIVAVKILKDEYLANEEFRLRFKNESKVISVLSHPNIVKVYDVSFGDKLQYIVMEHVEGITLKEYIERQGTLDWKEALHFVVQILRALQHAHDKGIIHRDIKPQNILLLPNANIKVTDFGIARFNRNEKNINESGAIGSVHYMSPEQARGELTDSRSDIYAVGVVLYEMLTGKLPFDSENDVSVALMQMREDAQKPSSINSNIPIGLEQITLRAMQKNPSDRYQSAAEFLLDLDEFKRNPLIKFDYSYFIDKNPTKYLETPIAQTAKPVHISDEEDVDDEDTEGEDEGEEDEEEDDAPRNLTIPILIGIAISLVVIVGIIFLLAFADPIKSLITGDSSSDSDSGFFSKLDIFGLFDNDLVEVPNFINMEYEAALEKYPELVIENPPQYIYNSKYEDGHICEQSPSAGEKISKDTVIKLTVATSNEIVLIKDVTNLDYIEAETILRSLGFAVESVATVDEEREENTVINTYPSVNTYAKYGETVYIYYASSSSEDNSSKVPNVVGDELSVARAKIIAAGLKVGSIIYEPSSEKLLDYVISQTPSAKSAVKNRTYVNLVVGNGVPASATATFSIYLPVAENKKDSTVKIYLNNTMVDTISDVKLDGSTMQLSITGEGSDNAFKIYVDESLCYTGKIDFTTQTPKISDVASYSYATTEDMPEVISLTEEQAKKTLEASGFKNIKVVQEYSSEYAAGLVCAQTPVASSLTKYSTAISITLTVSKGPDPSIPASSEPTSEPATQPVPQPATQPATQVPPAESEPASANPTEKTSEEYVISPEERTAGNG